jgi:hypothetical protein
VCARVCALRYVCGCGWVWVGGCGWVCGFTELAVPSFNFSCCLQSSSAAGTTYTCSVDLFSAGVVFLELALNNLLILSPRPVTASDATTPEVVLAGLAVLWGLRGDHGKALAEVLASLATEEAAARGTALAALERLRPMQRELHVSWAPPL